jgi:hypothetical protein
MIDFTKYKENLSVDAFVSIVSRDIINNLDDDTRENFKKYISFGEIHFSYGLHIRNRYIYPYLEKHRFGGKKNVDADSLSMMIVDKIVKKLGGKISTYPP